VSQITVEKIAKQTAAPTAWWTQCAWTITAFLLLTIVLAIRSNGFIAADACSHYLYAKYAFADPVNIVDVWGRPLVTLLFAGPAWLAGRMGVKIACVLMTAACGLVAGLIARDQNHRNPALAVLLTLGQPLLILFSFAEMTELPFALILSLAMWAFGRRQWVIFALLCGLLPAARPEGFAFLLVAMAILLLMRRLLPLAVLIVPLLAWDIAGWVITGRDGHWWMWLSHAWPWSTTSGYGRGNILCFVAVLPVLVSPFVLPATLAGIGLKLRGFLSLPRHAISDPTALHPLLCRVMVAAVPCMILISHSILRALGKFGTLGEARYLLVAAPLWGVLSAAGWEWIFATFNWKNRWRWAVVAVILPALVNVAYRVLPVRLDRDWLAAQSFATMVRQHELPAGHDRIISSHPGVYYFLNIDPTQNSRQNSFTRATIQRLPPHSILVWDPIYSAQNANLDDTSTLDAIRKSGWILLPEVSQHLTDMPNSGGQWAIFRSPT